MQRRPEAVKACEAELANDHSLMREAAAGAAVLLGDGRAKQTGRARLGPDLAVIDALLVPGLEPRRVFGRDEAPCLLLEQHDVLGHPGRSRKIECAHDRFSCKVWTAPTRGGTRQVPLTINQGVITNKRCFSPNDPLFLHAASCPPGSLLRRGPFSLHGNPRRSQSLRGWTKRAPGRVASLGAICG